MDSAPVSAPLYAALATSNGSKWDTEFPPSTSLNQHKRPLDPRARRRLVEMKMFPFDMQKEASLCEWTEDMTGLT